MELLVATGNPNKISELNTIVRLFQEEHPGFEIKLTGLHSLSSDIQTAYAVQENAPTLLDNAHSKAEALYRLTGRPTIAEDTGLEVDLLGGRPGVKAARYAPTDQEKISKLLGELKDFPKLEARTARFVTCLCFLDEDGNPVYFTGKAEGFIALEPAGSGGFGYDPVFISRDTGTSFAELSPADKNRLSHRARAMRGLLEFLQQWQQYQVT